MWIAQQDIAVARGEAVGLGALAGGAAGEGLGEFHGNLAIAHRVVESEAAVELADGRKMTLEVVFRGRLPPERRKGWAL